MSDFELKDHLLKLKKPICKKTTNSNNETSDDYTKLPQQYPIPIKLIDPNTNDYLDHYSAYLQSDGKIFVKNEFEAQQLYKHGYFGKGEFSRGELNCFRKDKFNNKSSDCDNTIARLKQIPEITQEKYDRRYEWHNKSKQEKEQNLDENNKSNNFNDSFINQFLKEYKIIDLSRNNNNNNNNNNNENSNNGNSTNSDNYVKIYRYNKSSEEEQLFDSNSKTNPFNYIIKRMPNYIFKENYYLMREEAYFLCYALGCLKVYDYITNLEINLLDLWRKFCNYDSQFVYKYIVYHKLRVDGWIVRNGLMYGSDFLIYYKGPDYYHSSYSIVVKPNGDNGDDLNNLFSVFAGLIRINENASKDVLVCYVLFDSDNVNLSTPNCIKRSYLKSVIANRWLPKQNRDNNITSNDDNNNNLNKNADDDD